MGNDWKGQQIGSVGDWNDLDCGGYTAVYLCQKLTKLNGYMWLYVNLTTNTKIYLNKHNLKVAKGNTSELLKK